MLWRGFCGQRHEHCDHQVDRTQTLWCGPPLGPVPPAESGDAATVAAQQSVCQLLHGMSCCILESHAPRRCKTSTNCSIYIYKCAETKPLMPESLVHVT